ncbi:MAG: carboxylesterase family protein [Prolixibacteraceae bacterium]|nr:carboxylesterase family protein [Prolixibacteraceae bacterium]
MVKKPVIILIAVFYTLISGAQPFRYKEKVFENVDTLKEVVYAVAPWLNNLIPIELLSEKNVHDGEAKTENLPLLMDIFLPHSDTLSKRPAIVFAHSGAFIIGSRLADDMVAFCDSFTRKGYVTATIDYRLGMGADVLKIFGLIISVNVTEKHAKRALYRGLQDSRAAIRFLKQNADNYGIDTTKIYFVGSSAGGFLSLHNLYVDKTEEIPSEVFEEHSLGGLDEIGPKGFGGTATTIASFWGALPDLDIIENDTTPVFLVHGKNDNVVPFKKGMPLSGIVPPNPLVGFTMPETYGSYCIDSVLNYKNISHESYFIEGKGHEFYGVNTGEFPEEGPNQYWDTINWKLNHFLFEQFQPNASFDFITNGLTVEFINQTPGIIQAEWDFGDGNASNEKDPVHSYSASGVYNAHLKVFNQNLACDTISKTIIVSDPVGNKTIMETSVTIFPNPVKNILNISGISAPFNLKIYDIAGVKLSHVKVSENRFDIGFLRNGVYLLVIEKDGNRIVRKISKIE